jgi:uncharacterized repeat protein (TIGR02543 family)
VVEQNNGESYTTSYDYNPLGDLLAIRDHLGNTSTNEYDSLGQKIHSFDVDLGQRDFSYDPVGNMSSQTDARGTVIKYQYDALNRLTLTDYPNDKDVQFIYDIETKGALYRVYNSLGTDSFKYDQRLRKIQEDRTMDGQTWTTRYDYDSMDRVISQTYPDGEVVTYAYNAQSRLAKIERASQTILDGTAYNAAGQMTQKRYGNGLNTVFTYDPKNLRLTNILATKTYGKLQDIAYTYDNTGNVKTLKDAVSGRTETFTYDALDRMVNAHDNLTTGGFDVSYIYNAVGNLTSETDNKTQAVAQYTYGQGTAKPHAVTGKTDKLPNVGSFVIDNGQAYCTKQQVTLNNISMGVTPGNATDFYMASEDPNFSGAVWRPFLTAPVFSLSALDASKPTKTVFFKVKNANGESKAKSDDIQYLLDTDGDSIADVYDNDKDNDGIPDAADAEPLNPGNALLDPDGDGLSNLQEYLHGANPGLKDTDSDGWSDYHEIFTSRTKPYLADTDKDGIQDPIDPSPNNPYNDGFSANYSVKRWMFNAGGGIRTGTLYAAADNLGSGFGKGALSDADGDGMPDKWETDHVLDPAKSADAVQDADGDGLTNLQEYLYGTNPVTAEGSDGKDSDGDGWSDYQEIFIYHTNPLDKDSDKDGIRDPQDPEPSKPTYIYGLSEKFTLRSGNFNAGGNNRGSEAYAVASDQIGGFLKSKATYHAKCIITPELVNFENTQTYQSRTANLVISNQGIENLVIGAVTLTGSDNNEFGILQENCSGMILSPSVSCVMQLSFAPKSPGAKGATLAILYNDGDIKNSAVAMSGIATIAPPQALSVMKTGNGAVTSSPSGIDCGFDCSESYEYGTTVTLTASALAGSTFTGWYGDCTGTANQVDVLIDRAKTCKAIFSPEGDVNGDGTVSLMDAILILKALVNTPSTDNGPNVPIPVMDVNSDGNVGLSEVIYILQKAAGMR